MAKGFPVSIPKNADFNKVCATESRMFALSGLSPALGQPEPTVVANGLTAFGNHVVLPGRALLLQSIVIGANKECRLTISWSIGGLDGSYLGAYSSTYATIPNGGGTVTIEFPVPLMLIEGSKIDLFYTRPDTVGATMSWGVNAVDLTGDFQYGAQKRIAVIGDSITWTGLPSTGSFGKDLWAFRLVEQLRKEGQSVRLINKGFGGSKSIDGAVMAKRQWLDFEYDLLIISYGMNDCVNGQTTEANYKQALRDIIAQRDSKNPHASVIVCGASSTNDAQRTPHIANYRAYAASVAAEYGAAKNVYYVDLSTAFSGTQADHFSEVGTLVHPNRLGHQKLFETIYPVVQTTPLYLNA